MKRFTALVVGVASAAALLVSSAFANHPVLVEGNCLGTGTAQRTAVPPGTCGDYDGDGRIGSAEDTDEADRVFGTINAALGPGNVGSPAVSTGVNQNGSVTIVASGVFPEVVTITAANGNVTLQAAPGVEANIDAVVQGDAGTTPRQSQPGIIVNAPANRYVVVRNITSRNWTSGIQVLGNSRVALESVRAENNVNYGIEIADNARVTIAKSEVHGTGFRTNPVTGNFPTPNVPSPGKGIEFDDSSSGTVFLTTVSGSFGAGISNMTGRRFNVCVSNVNVFDNSPNFESVLTTCPNGSGTGPTPQSSAKKANAKPSAKKAPAKKAPAKKTSRKAPSKRGKKSRGASFRSSTDPECPCSKGHSGSRHCYPRLAMLLAATAIFHVVVSFALMGLILMHSGRDAGLAGMGYTPASQGGTHIVERNLTRLTIVVATVFFLNTVLLFHLLT